MRFLIVSALFFYAALSCAITDPTRPLFLLPDGQSDVVDNTKTLKVTVKQHRLEAVFISEKRSVVIINGKEYQKFDVIDGYIIGDIRRDNVIMKKDKKEKIIYLYPDSVVKVGDK